MALAAGHLPPADLASTASLLHGNGFPDGLQLVHGSNILDQSDHPGNPGIMISSDALKLSTPHAASNAGGQTLHDDAVADHYDALNVGNANMNQGSSPHAAATPGSQAKVGSDLLPGSILSSLTVELFGSAVSDSSVEGQESVQLVAVNEVQDLVQPDAEAKDPSSGALNEGSECDVAAYFPASREHNAQAQAATKSVSTTDLHALTTPLSSQLPLVQQNAAASDQCNRTAHAPVHAPAACTHAVDLAHALPPGCVVHQAHDSITTTTRSIFQKTTTGEYQEHAAVISSCCSLSPHHNQIASQNVDSGAAAGSAVPLPFHHLASLQHKPISTIPDNQQRERPQQQALSASGPQTAESHMIGNISSTSGGATMGGIAAAGGAQMEHLLARVKQEKIASRARAWEENAKSKALNRYTRDETKIAAWENSMKAKAEARMRKLEEKLEKQRAIYVEKMKNAVAVAHRAAQEMRAATEARKAEEIVRANDIASRIRATGQVPRKFLCLHA